jgi:glycogen synthase
MYRMPEIWPRLMRRGMSETLSWDGPARQYMALYEQLRSEHGAGVTRPID